MENFSTPKAFGDYMQRLASLHVSLAHTPEEPHYFRGELEEFYTGLRDRVNFPALIQEGSEIRFTSDQARNSFKERDSSFMIVQGYECDNDYDAIYAAFDLCEKIGDEIIRRINADKYDPACMVVKDFLIEDASAVQIQNVRERYVGVRYTFSPKTPFWHEPDKNMWKDERD
ncbi:MAG: hypothetical protein LBI45_07445 [Bacteroidales bacterium]|jgi:hypothetical protein|nr:hypothetical protein [Bacteroidales bacterium]